MTERIAGPCEVHIIVAPDEEALLFALVLDLSCGLPPVGSNPETAKELGFAKLSNVRATCAQTFYGRYPRQPMLTAWSSGDSIETRALAWNLRDLIVRRGMSVLRVKIEALASSGGVPERITDERYFEFHFKVAITSPREWNNVADVCAKYGAHLFFNPYSQSGKMQPVVTLRCYDTTRNAAEMQLNELITALMAAKFSCQPVQREFSVLDTAVTMDAGWLFSDHPARFLTHVPVYA